MNYYTRLIGLLLIAIAMANLYIGCSPIASRYRKQGFDYIQKGFAHLPDSPDLYEEIVIDRLKIIIVGSREHFKWEEAERADSGILAYATDKNEIYLLGKRIGDKIVINQAVLGHELNHIINFNTPKIADPHQMDKLELCAFESGNC